VQQRFAHLATAQLIARMNCAPDFAYDDEEVELTRRLEPIGRDWRWTQTAPPRVEIYTVTEPAPANALSLGAGQCE
jgi:hypothetical protein